MRYKLAPISCKYGAPMGRPNRTDHSNEYIKLHLEKVPSVSGGDYDQGGAYWGGMREHPLYIAYGHTDDGTSQRLFVRATNRNDAKEKVKAVFPLAKFYR